MRTKKINFILPNMIECFFINRLFILLQKNSPTYFNENYVISGVTGTIDYSIWNTHRTSKYINFSSFKTIYDFYNKNKISINFLFENEQINNEDLYDTFSNLILKYAHNKNNAVSATSEILKKYIKRKYPKFKFIEHSQASEIKKSKEDYIILNPICDKNCKLLKAHKQYLDNEQKLYYSPSKIFTCPLKKSTSFYDLQTNPDFVSNDEIKNYINFGFNNFKIEANYITNNTNINYSMFDIIESYIYYLIKPEFQNEVRNKAVKEYLKSLQKRSLKNRNEQH